MPRKLAAASLYSPHPSIQYALSVVANMERKTGRTLDEWVANVKKSGPKTDDERRDWLKKEHDIGTNTSWWIVERTAGRGKDDLDPEAYLKAAPGYVEAMYAGGKAGLRSLHDLLID